MRDLDQTIIKFDYDKNFKSDDFYLSKSNKHVFDFLNIWPKWERNFVNITGEKLSGKTHLMNIFLRKNKGIKFEAKSLKNDDLKKCPQYWGGFSFTPYYFEFWEGHESRINKREVFNKIDGLWKQSYLQP